MKANVFCIAAVCGILLCGCAGESHNATTQIQAEAAAPASPVKISPEEAKAVLDSGASCLLLDVRTQEEYDNGHIPGALLIPDTELTARSGELPEDKDCTILVYCRSGRRSAASAAVLAELGYRDVRDFGGILDWPYETEGTQCVQNAAAESVDAAGTDNHDHIWQEYDCNYMQCTLCGAQKRYGN